MIKGKFGPASNMFRIFQIWASKYAYVMDKHKQCSSYLKSALLIYSDSSQINNSYKKILKI